MNRIRKIVAWFRDPCNQDELLSVLTCIQLGFIIGLLANVL